MWTEYMCAFNAWSPLPFWSFCTLQVSQACPGIAGSVVCKEALEFKVPEARRAWKGRRATKACGVPPSSPGYPHLMHLTVHLLLPDQANMVLFSFLWRKMPLFSSKTSWREGKSHQNTIHTFSRTAEAKLFFSISVKCYTSSKSLPHWTRELFQSWSRLHHLLQVWRPVFLSCLFLHGFLRLTSVNEDRSLRK